MQNINEIDELVKLISKLPGLGPKSAKRIVLKLINNRDELVKPLAKSLADVYKNIVRCKICGILKSNSIECNFDDCKIVEKKYNKILVPNLGDHRICMSSFILAKLTGVKSFIRNFETVFTSSPSFLEIIKSLGANFEKQK